MASLRLFGYVKLKKQTKRPISHLFNMIAGTSVGAVIASALSKPKMEKTDEDGICVPYISKFEPEHSAFAIVDLFNKKSKEIFSKAKKAI